MKHQRLPMSVEEYRVLEQPFGWKVEYWDGQAHFTPRGMGGKTAIDLRTVSLPQQINSQQHILVPVDVTYAEQMMAGYFDAFINSVEFCDWPVQDFQRSAERCINRYFEGKRGEPLPASVIALNSDKGLVGLALFVVGKEQRPHLDLLYVRSSFQRQGIATAMLHHGISHLLKAKFQELSSSYHTCNHISRQWHHKLGFQDIYDWYYLRLKIGWLRNEIWRRKKLGMLTDLDELRREQEYYQAQLEEKESEQFR